MNYNKKQYQHKGWKALTMFFAICLALAGTAALTACSSDEDPFFTVSENDDPRILNTDLADQTLDRLTNLNIEIKVTPIQYTTVTWFLDGVQIAEGNIIDQTLPVGNHQLKIVATTTKGKSTSRTINVLVTPVSSDPYPDGSDIHETLVKQGTKATMHGSNMSKVVKVIIGGTAVDATYIESGDYIEYIVPDLADGEYSLQLVDAEGNVFDAGTIELNHDPAYPVGGEIELWKGTKNVDWSDIWEADDAVNAELMKHASVGAILRLYVTRTADDYCMACPTVGWKGLLTGGEEDARGDVQFDGEQVLEFVLNETSMRLLNGGGLQVVGHGFNLTKVTIDTPTEVQLWKGTKSVDWSDIWEDDGTITAQLKSFAKVGTTVHLFVKRTADDYCMACLTVGWKGITTGGEEDARGDVQFDGETVIDFVLNETSMQLLEQGNIQVVGHGFDLLKITAE